MSENPSLSANVEQMVLIHTPNHRWLTDDSICQAVTNVDVCISNNNGVVYTSQSVCKFHIRGIASRDEIPTSVFLSDDSVPTHDRALRGRTPVTSNIGPLAYHCRRAYCDRQPRPSRSMLNETVVDSSSPRVRPTGHRSTVVRLRPEQSVSRWTFHDQYGRAIEQSESIANAPVVTARENSAIVRLNPPQ